MHTFSNDSHLLHFGDRQTGLPPGGTWEVTFLGKLPFSSGALPALLDSAVDYSVSLQSGCMPYPDAA